MWPLRLWPTLLWPVRLWGALGEPPPSTARDITVTAGVATTGWTTGAASTGWAAGKATT